MLTSTGRRAGRELNFCLNPLTNITRVNCHDGRGLMCNSRLQYLKDCYAPQSAIKCSTITYYSSNEILMLHLTKLQSKLCVVGESCSLCMGFITPKNFQGLDCNFSH